MNGDEVEVEAAEQTDDIARILSWEYDNKAAAQVAAKTSITALKNQQTMATAQLAPPSLDVPEEQHERHDGRGLEHHLSIVGSRIHLELVTPP